VPNSSQSDGWDVNGPHDEAARKLAIDIFPRNTYNVDIMADLLGAFEQSILLAVWTLAQEAYGRAILRGVQSALERQVAAGAVYATLDRLEQKGFIASRLEEGTPVRAGRARRYYRLTAAGIKALNESRAALEHMWQTANWPLESKA
jgi:DNA-binding PadR family transcriptional regulator